MRIYKTSAAGNTFLHLRDSAKLSGKEAAALARRLCAPTTGPGADGLILFEPEAEGAAFTILNSDGSRAELSGNGMAGLATVLFSEFGRRGELLLRSPSGPRRIALRSRWGSRFRLRLEIGSADFERRAVFPFLEGGKLRYEYNGIPFYPVSVGNPHAVVLWQEAWESQRLATVGCELQGAPLFPEGVNVELVKTVGRRRCRTFFYERGAGPTASSATGSAAVFSVLRRLGIAADPLRVAGKGGTITVTGYDPIQVINSCRIVSCAEIDV